MVENVLGDFHDEILHRGVMGVKTKNRNFFTEGDS